MVITEKDWFGGIQGKKCIVTINRPTNTELEEMRAKLLEELENNIKIYDEFLTEYEKVYEKAGLNVNRFLNVDDFVVNYMEV